MMHASGSEVVRKTYKQRLTVFIVSNSNSPVVHVRVAVQSERAAHPSFQAGPPRGRVQAGHEPRSAARAEVS
jgi:hypothetical protein